MTQPRDEIIRYRLERAHETLEEAEILAQAGHWNACVNRLSYACFYAATALLLREGLSAAKHAGVRSLFNEHLVRSGRVPHDIASVFNRLLDKRQEGDYADLMQFHEQQVRPWIADARQFVAFIAGMLQPPESRQEPQPE